MYAELGFVRPDGSIHRALAFVDMGSPSMTLTESLFQELQLDQNHPLRFRVGDLLVEVPRAGSHHRARRAVLDGTGSQGRRDVASGHLAEIPGCD